MAKYATRATKGEGPKTVIALNPRDASNIILQLWRTLEGLERICSCHPLQVIFIHYKSRIATAIRGL